MVHWTREAVGLASIWTVLVGIGLIMASSAPVMIAQDRFGDPLFFFKRQVFYAAVGLIALIVCIRIPYNLWLYPTVMRWIFLGCTVGLIAVLWLPPIRSAHRWIRLGPLSLQPSEFAKLGLILYLAFLAHRAGRTGFRRWQATTAYALIVPALWALLILCEPDLGNGVILLVLAGLLVFIYGIPMRVLLLGGGVLAILIGIAFTVWVDPPQYWIERIRAYLEPEAYRQTAAYQQYQAMIALGHAGPWGTGFGRGMQKLFYLPESYNDYVFAVLGEELGLPGTLAVTLLYFVLWILGIRVAQRAWTPAGSLMAMGIACWIALQAFLNISVVTGLLPSKGVVLPLISYGGSALVIFSAAMGILISIANHNFYMGESDAAP